MTDRRPDAVAGQHAARPRADRSGWRDKIRSRGSAPVHAAPVVDVDRGAIAGFDCTGPGGTPCTAAHVEAALSVADRLPRNSFLSVSVPWDAVCDGDSRAALLSHGNLGGVIVAVSGLRASAAAADAEQTIDAIRSAGALLALHADDVSRPGFVWWMRLRPALIVLDAEWTRGIGGASRRQFAVDAVGRIAANADAWLLASHVESADDFATLAEMGVPLARGPFIGASVPLGAAGTTGADEPTWPTLSAEVRRALRPSPAGEPGPIRGLLEPAVVVDSLLEARMALARDPAAHVVLADHDGRARWLTSLAADGDVARAELLRVNVDTPVADAVPRALARPEESRADPIAAVDAAGRLLGLVSMSRLVALTSAHGAAAPDLYADWSTIVDALPRPSS